MNGSAAPGDFETPVRAAKTCPFVAEQYNRSCSNACALWIPHTEDPRMGLCSITSIAVSLAVIASSPLKS